MRHLWKKRELPNRGQVLLEYVWALIIFSATVSLLWIFYQGFFVMNLYGDQGGMNEAVFQMEKGRKGLGLEQVVALPFP